MAITAKKYTPKKTVEKLTKLLTYNLTKCEIFESYQGFAFGEYSLPNGFKFSFLVVGNLAEYKIMDIGKPERKLKMHLRSNVTAYLINKMDIHGFTV